MATESKEFNYGLIPQLISMTIKYYGIPTKSCKFFVDDVPIRVFENQTSRGVEYPTQPMKIVASLWDGSDWATDGGKAKIDWTQAPFVAQFEGVNIDGCASQGSSPSSSYSSCSSSDLWWNGEAYRQLSPAQISAFEKAKTCITYDYCSDKQRFPTLPPECQR